jgi:hypothetical protein
MVIVALQLSPDEPEAGRWNAQLVTDVAAALLELGQARGAGHRPVVLAVEDLIACGTPEISFDPAVEVVVSSRPGR